VLVFENATTDPVAIYLVENGSEWLVGHSQPGRTSMLRLPAVTLDPTGRVFSIKTVPVGTRRFAVRTNGVPPVASSEQFPAAYVSTMRWKLSGTRLVALPIPGVAGRR
jgi:hypothetical protein